MGLMDWVKEQKDKTVTGVKQFANKDFMEAVAAGCAMIASADGSIDSAEKQKMVGFITINESLKVFKLNDVLERFNYYAQLFEFDFNVGKSEAIKAILKIKKNASASRTCISVCCSIGAADGNFDKDEMQLVKEICTHLGINPSEFEL